MKKLLLFAVSAAFAGMVSAQDCTSMINYAASTLGLNPNPPAGSVAGIPYDEVNTLVLPDSVENPFSPGDSIGLCLLEINDVDMTALPSGYMAEVWAFHSPGDSYDVLAQVTDTIHLFHGGDSKTHICIRLKHASPPAPTDMGDGLPDRDSALIIVAVEAWTDLGVGCAPLGPTGRDTFEVNLAIKSAVYAGIDGEDNNGFTVGNTYPNPAVDVTYLNYTIPQVDEVTITVFDAVGRNVKNVQVLSYAGGNVYALNTADLKSGVYMYNITYGNKTYSRRLIINK